MIKAQFRAGYGARSQAEYDRFTTALANAYGADPTSAETCRQTAEAATQAVAADGDANKLIEIVDAMGPTPSLPGGACRITFAGGAK